MPRLDTCRRVFFSFPAIRAGHHEEYDAWHRLDHQPENLALDGVLHGDRWTRTERCREVGYVDPRLDADHVATYWFADPVRESVAEWLELGQTTLELGRRPDLDWTTRRLTGFFRPLAGTVTDVASSAPISSSALPYRAHAGIVLEVLRVDAPRSAAATSAAAQWHRSHAETRRLPGVTGTWAFASRDVTLGEERLDQPGELLVAVHFCHGDPVDVARALPEVSAPPGTAVLFRAPLESLPPLG